MRDDHTLCKCGCGQSAPLASMTRTARGQQKGQPVSFIVGHAAKLHFYKEERHKEEDRGYSTKCWIWQLASWNGYGRIRHERRACGAHIAAYETSRGHRVPEGMEIDHLCRVPLCVNPAHLEAVTHRVNMARAASFRTHCPHGHPYSGENLFVNGKGARRCRICLREQNRNYNRRRRSKCPVNS